ncbi:MAG: alanine racemase [Steroidobacteraceae bacterium]|nr:alanine racemase [Steroidobacteraceae bacterium]
MSLDALDTPCLLLDRARMERNLARLRARLDGAGVRLRPHLKTAKCVEVARRMMDAPSGPATVSTLHEAEAFAAAGVTDLLYAVGIAPQKLGRVAALLRRGIRLTVLVDELEQARAVAAASADVPIPTLIEIDTDDHRSGVRPDDPRLLRIGEALHAGGAELCGVLTHAGGSYDCRGEAALAAIAERERAGAVHAAGRLRAAGLPAPVVSVGSTPTAYFARDWSGVTEVRAGVYVFFDLVMAGLGVCSVGDVAIGVLATVIGHQRDKRQIVVDAGWMALSADRGTARQPVDQGHGLVCDVHGVPYPDLVVARANQEHGLLEVRAGSNAPLPELPVGARVRILPNHACATAAQHPGYVVVEDGQVVTRWPRLAPGW